MSTQAQPTTAVAKVTAKQAISQHLHKSAKAIQSLLPEGQTTDRVIAQVMLEVAKKPDLQKCTPASILQSVADAASLGLMPCGPLQHGYLIPYRAECTFQPSYRGLIDLVRRSGHLVSISGRVVYENDMFSLVYTNGKANCKHEPNLTEPGKIKLVYGCCELKGGGLEFEHMTVAEVEKVRARSQAKTGPWQTDYEEMAKKTVLRRLLKRLPASPELARAIEMDDKQYEADMATATVKSADSLRERLANAAVKPAEPVTDADFEMVSTPEPEAQ